MIGSVELEANGSLHGRAMPCAPQRAVRSRDVSQWARTLHSDDSKDSVARKQQCQRDCKLVRMRTKFL